MFFQRRPLLNCFLLLLSLWGTGCSRGDNCEPLDDTLEEWTPQVSGAGDSLHDSGVVVSQTDYTLDVPVIGRGSAWSSGVRADFNFTVSEDLGPGGSITLVAEIVSWPSALEGRADPMLARLISPGSGTPDWVNLSSSCASSGFSTCSGSSCTDNTSCATTSPSAFQSRDHWEQHQVSTFDYLSVNTFPTCDFPSDTTNCAFNDQFFESTDRLPQGTYTASYFLVSDRYASLSGTKTATLRVRVIQKKDASAKAASGNGAFDLNVVLVGNKNINASRSAKGGQNLNALLQHVQDQYAQSGTGLGLGAVRAIEWKCGKGGEDYQDMEASALGALFYDGSQKAVSSSTEGKAINLFLVSSITLSSSGTLLGVSGGINGPPVNGTGGSGVAVVTFDELEEFNPDCDGEGTCNVVDQEAFFVDMGGTIAHELGHYLNLNHPSERNGIDHDFLTDTVECGVGTGSSVSHTSCRTTVAACGTGCVGYSSSGPFCPTVSECQFNHVMWWTSKNYDDDGNGDGNLFSDQSARVLGRSPFVR